MLYLYIFIFILILILLSVFILNYVNFLNNDFINNFLINDNDNYIKNMTIYDLRARNVNSINNYKNNIKNLTYNLNLFEKIRIIYLCIKVDLFFKNLKSIYLPKNHNINKIKWNICFMKNNIYEEGLPHTRNDIIFLPKTILNNNNNNLIKILIHEKIHIYQRYNKNKITEILKKLGYKKYKIRNKIKLIRSNPDLDNYIYIDNNNNKYYYEYNNEYPKNINDIKKSNIYEHPYEMISYIIEKEW
jgi:hypothetical protein